MKALINANIISDFFLSKGITETDKIFGLIYKEKVKAFVTAKCIADVYCIMSKERDESSARHAVEHLLKLFSVVSVDHKDCADALNLPILNFEDALVVVCAIKEHIDCIVTNDEVLLQMDLPFIKVINSTGFLDML